MSHERFPTHVLFWLLAIVFLPVAFVTCCGIANGQDKSDFVAFCERVSQQDDRHTLRIIMRILQEDDFQKLEEQLKSSQTLILPNEEIISVKPIRHFDHLVGLNLAKNKISDASALAELTAIETILLQDNLINDLAFLRKLSKLKRLNLSGNQLSQITDLQHNTSLISLNLGKNPAIQDVGCLKDLKLVNLSLNQTATGNTIHKILPQPALVNLDLAQTGLVDLSEFAKVGNLPRIRKLLLGNNKIQSIEPLKSLKSLGAIDISGNPLHDLTTLENHTQLIALNISNINAAKQTGSLSKLSRLLELYARESGLKDLSWLKDMNDKMRTLDLGNNQISDVSAIYKFANLKVLRLEGNPIADINVTWLQSLNQLQDFDIDILGIKSLKKRKQLIEIKANILERMRISK